MKEVRFGVVCRPRIGERKNGDGYLIKEWDGQTLMVVADGLGHGEEASAASQSALEYIAENFAKDIEETVKDCDQHLRHTRGAVVGLVRVDRKNFALTYLGVGNIDIRVKSEPSIHPFSRDGIVGLNIRNMKKQVYRYKSLSFIALNSDGISSRYDLSNHLKLLEEPQQAAEHIARTWGKENDDATILIGVETAGTRKLEKDKTNVTS